MGLFQGPGPNYVTTFVVAWACLGDDRRAGRKDDGEQEKVVGRRMLIVEPPSWVARQQPATSARFTRGGCIDGIQGTDGRCQQTHRRAEKYSRYRLGIWIFSRYRGNRRLNR
jgi:hypothetical protein